VAHGVSFGILSDGGNAKNSRIILGLVAALRASVQILEMNEINEISGGSAARATEQKNRQRSASHRTKKSAA
jgi:hypothetical protein